MNSKHQDNFHCSEGAMPTRRRGRGQYKVHVTVCYHTALYWDQTHFSVQHLSSTFHTDFFSNKIASRLFVEQIYNFCDLQAMNSAFFALIHSHVSIGIVAYWNMSAGNFNRILVMQEEAIRIILKLSWLESEELYFSQY